MSAAEVVKADYRAAEVFDGYGIKYCCGVKLPLAMVCDLQQVAKEELFDKLSIATRRIEISPMLDFQSWGTTFLTEYISNVHHSYAKKIMLTLTPAFELFVTEHLRQYPVYEEALFVFKSLSKHLVEHIHLEESITFPYISQLENAYLRQDRVSVLLVKTLRKPIPAGNHLRRDEIAALLGKIKLLTNKYTAPAAACTSHNVLLSRLREFDQDLEQHTYLEDQVLFPRAISMEKELLALSV